MLELRGHELRTNMIIKTPETVFLLLVCSSFASFTVSFGHIKSPKYTKLYWMASPVRLYNLYCVLEPLWHEWRRKINTNVRKQQFSLFEFSMFAVSFQLIKSPKYTKLSSMACSVDLHRGLCMLEPLGRELPHKHESKHTKNCTYYISSLKFFNHLWLHLLTLNHQNAQSYFKWRLIFVYMIIIAFSNFYMTRMTLNDYNKCMKIIFQFIRAFCHLGYISTD